MRMMEHIGAEPPQFPSYEKLLGNGDARPAGQRQGAQIGGTEYAKWMIGSEITAEEDGELVLRPGPDESGNQFVDIPA